MLTHWGNVESGTTFTKIFRKGQVLFGKRRAYLKKLAVADFDGICSADILVLEAKPEKILPELLPYVLQNDAFSQYAVKTSAGSLSPRTKWKDIASFEFYLPEIVSLPCFFPMCFLLPQKANIFAMVLSVCLSKSGGHGEKKPGKKTLPRKCLWPLDWRKSGERSVPCSILLLCWI